MRIIFVEDNPTDALLVEAALEDSGMELESFVHVETLGEAEEKLRNNIFDVVLVDLNVPDGSGLGNFERMQRLAPNAPVIVLTGLSDEEIALEAIHRGAADYLIKGQTESALLERSIRYALERKRNEKQRLALERAEIKRAEAEAANRAKDEFLAMLSHELRTPLNAILGWVSLLRAEPLDAETTEQAFDIIERNARIQAQLVEDLLDVSRIVAGNLVLERVGIDFNGIVQAAAETLAPSANAKNLNLTFDLEPMPRICGDAVRLQQVVWNLITNAIKFTPEGGTVNLRTTQMKSPVPMAVLEVRDSGQGISADFLPYVFERFRQADASTTRRHGGLGLGLAIVKNVVELHEGTVSVHSDGHGRGANFRVELPLHSGDCDPASLELDEAVQGMDWSRVKVLVVDDQTEAREFVRLTLARCGALVKTAGTAEEALLVIETWKPHCLVTDIGMPDVDGYRLLEMIGGINTPMALVAITGFAHPGEKERALMAGFQEFLAKPVEAEELCQAVSSAVLERGVLVESQIS